MTQPKKLLECTIPVLPVRDLAASARFYTEILDFKLDWTSATICSVSRDGCGIMLQQNRASDTPAWVWIGLEDASLFDEFRARGVEVAQEPRNYSWAYEMKFKDLDGNVLWLGTEPRTDLPLEA